LAQDEIEIILLKQLANCLAMPMLIIGPESDLLFFNESAEPILGRRFDETGEMLSNEWSALIQASDDSGAPIKYEERPMIVALERREPVHRRFWIRGFEGERCRIEGTAVPLVGLDGRLLGALALFWELDRAEIANPEVEAAKPDFRQHAVETILTRRLASNLAMPTFLIDGDGRPLYFNDAAVPLLGRRFEELAAKPRAELYAAFRPTGEDGAPIARDDHPLSIAHLRREPGHHRFWIRALDGVPRLIAATAIPLIGQAGRMLGTFGFFWEIDAS